MKKILLSLAALCCCMALGATNYTCHLEVNVNGNLAEQEEVPVVVVEENGYYTLTLKNFVLVQDGVSLPVGNIEVSGVTGQDQYGYTKISLVKPIQITAGDDPAVGGEDAWIGPLLGEVPIDLTARFTPTALDATIDIRLEAMGQTIGVKLFGVVPVVEGDVNGDNDVNISDVNKVVSIILSH